MAETNGHKPFTAETYKAEAGNKILSDHWNALVDEIKWLGDAKVNRSGDTIKGPLNIEEALTVKKGQVDIGVKDEKTEVNIEGDLKVNGTISGNIDAKNITSGQLAVERIPDLPANKITEGSVNGNLNINGGLTVKGTGVSSFAGAIHASNSDIYFTKTDHNHTAFSNTTSYATIENAVNYNALMILGRAGTDKGRSVRLWDYLEVNGNLDVTGKIFGNNARVYKVANNPIDCTSDNWVDMANMNAKIRITKDKTPVLILFKTGGVQSNTAQSVRARFRILVDNVQKAFTLHEFHNKGWELRDVTLTHLDFLNRGERTIKVQWRRETHTFKSCWYNDTRNLIIVEL